MMGGTSTVELGRVEPGAAETAAALSITGEVRQGMSPWSGAMFFPGPQPMAPSDLSRFRAIEMWVRGEAGEYRLLGFATSLGMMPAEHRFEVTEDWTRVEVPFEALTGLDPKVVTGFFVGAGPEVGPFRLEVDEVRLLE
jgi:hypothetical protein